VVLNAQALPLGLFGTAESESNQLDKARLKIKLRGTAGEFLCERSSATS
jgi:hypothetical protein